jgi:hypothetical protein
MRALVLCASLLTGCVTQHRIVVTGNALQRGAAGLRTHGEATVDASDELDDGRVVAHREVVHLDQTLVFDGESHTIRVLVNDCPGGAGCALTALTGFPIEVRRFESRNVGRALGATAFGLGATAVIAAVACGLGCRDGSTPKQASEITMGVAGVAIVGGLVWLLISCAGSGSCRD